MAEDSPSAAAPRNGAVSTLLRWYRPYLKGYTGPLAWIGFASLVVLGTQVLIPLIVEDLLHHGEWDTEIIFVLAAMIVLQLAIGHAAHLAAHKVSTGSAHAIRVQVFAKTLTSDVLHQRGLRRPSIVTRHATDVDEVAEAVKLTLIEGFPGVLRVLLSLGMLMYIEWRAGLAMAAVSLIFVLFRTRIGKSLLEDDRQRLESSSDLKSGVDEALSASRVVVGLHLESWMERRFERLSKDLEHKSEKQEHTVARLVLGAHSTALSGLLFVVVFALALGGNSLASVAASILYVEGVVAGLEVLPAWMRAVQLGVASEVRIDRILLEPDRIDVPAGETSIDKEVGITLDGLSARFESATDIIDVSVSLPPGNIIGVVTPVGTEPDEFLSLLAGDENPDTGHVRFNGSDVRMPGVAKSMAYVPAVGVGFEDSPLTQLMAVNPEIEIGEATTILTSVGLAHLADSTTTIETTLGHGASRLTVNERQRLSLAVALAAEPEVLLIGPIHAFSDSEMALPLLEMFRASLIDSVLVGVGSPDVAESVDQILFLDGGKVHLGAHNELLDSVPTYAQLWEQRLSFGEVDLSVLGIADEIQDTLTTKLVTERYSHNDPIYRQGDEADRIVFVISGRVEISLTDDDGVTRRVAVLGPGNHCGDLRLTAAERRAENASAIEDSVVRTLSREAISAGVFGILDRTPNERRIMTMIMRDGPATKQQLADRMPGVSDEAILAAISLLLGDAAVQEDDGVFSLVSKRSSNRGAGAILDRLTDL